LNQPQVQKPKLICVTGIDGSGKSTLIRSLQSAFPFSVTITIWDMMKNPEFKDSLLFETKQEIDEYLKLLEHPARILFLYHCLAQAMSIGAKEASKSNASLILLDGYWFKYAASEIAFGADAQEIIHLAQFFPKPDIVFRLALDSNVAFSRKESCSGYECGYEVGDSKTGFVSFQSRSAAAITNLLISENTQVLDGASSTEFNLKYCLKEISKLS
jgi:thymidylate kinase